MKTQLNIQSWISINDKSKLTQDTLHRQVNTDLSKYINLRRSS